MAAVDLARAAEVSAGVVKGLVDEGVLEVVLLVGAAVHLDVLAPGQDVLHADGYQALVLLWHGDALGAALMAGLIRDNTGEYTLAWFGAAGLCAVAAVISLTIRRPDNAAEPSR